MVRRWSACLWRALTALGETYYPWDQGFLFDPWSMSAEFPVDPFDDAGVRAAFAAIVAREWNVPAVDPPPPHPPASSPKYPPETLPGTTRW